jgi:hypothetical protein
MSPEFEMEQMLRRFIRAQRSAKSAFSLDGLADDAERLLQKVDAIRKVAA